jgi:hypothetical protein
MTTMKDLVADTRRIAYGSMADQLNFLAVEATAGATTLEFTMDVTPITPGMVLSSGLNVYYVISVNANTKVVTVHTGYDNSRSEVLPVGSAVMIRPRVTDWLLFNGVNDVIRAMSSSTHGLYKEGTWTADVDPAWQTYDIPVADQGMTAFIKAQIRQPGSTDVWFDLPVNSVQWQPENNLIRMTRDYQSGTEIKFFYRGGFTLAADLTDDVVADCGLAETMIDIPPLGAAVLLLRTTEARRSQIHSQSDPRRAEEVVSGSNSSAARELDRDFRARVNDEYVRLLNRNPLTQVV